VQGTPARLIWRGNPDRREVALTFDAGSDRGFAPQILDYLAAQGLRATFGMTGRWAEANPDLVRRMFVEGHVLMNHTYDHPHMETLTTAQRLSQLSRAESSVAVTTGSTSTMRPWFRPPYGAYSGQVLVDVASVGYDYSVMWTVDSLGWQGLAPASVTRRCLDRAVPGAIYLLHVGAQSTDWAALPAIVDGLREEWYGFVTVPEVIR
jgi:peptidoglycan/xylan/chitin deacetylase (PgdA/CDA1 family)